jgi:hypothetical protein
MNWPAEAGSGSGVGGVDVGGAGAGKGSWVCTKKSLKAGAVGRGADPVVGGRVSHLLG